MASLLQILASGLLTGALYAVIASGFALTFGAARVFNLSHGELVVIGGYLAYGLWSSFHLNPLFAVLPAALLVIPLALGLKQLLRLIGEPFELRALVLTFGVSLLLQSLMQGLFTSNYRLVTAGLEESVAIGPVSVSRGQLLAGGLALVLLAALSLFLNGTFLGKAMRAASFDQEAASLMGINPERVGLLALSLGGAMAGLVGPLFASFHYLTPAAGLDATLISLILTILGGVGRPSGLLVGGLTVGLAEALAVSLLGAQWREAVTSSLLLALFQRRAFGLLPGKRYEGGS